MTGMKTKPSAWTILLGVTIVIVYFAFAHPWLWIWRRLRGKRSATDQLELGPDEMRSLERAGADGFAVFVNGRQRFLRPFLAERDMICWECGCCPDELTIDDVRGRPCLSASRERGSTNWVLTAYRPVAFGLFDVADDLKTLVGP